MSNVFAAPPVKYFFIGYRSRTRTLINLTVLVANSTNTFKRRLDIYWQDQEIIYDFHAQLQGTGSRSEVFRL